MNCSNCKHWFCNPRIEVSDGVIVGRCMVSDVFTLDNNVCNAWELSQVAEVVKVGVQIEYLNEDELPDGIPDAVYSAMYACSEVDFVRLFPFVTINGQKRFLIELPEEQQ